MNEDNLRVHTPSYHHHHHHHLLSAYYVSGTVSGALYESAQVFSSSQLPYELGTIDMPLVQKRTCGTERLSHLPIVTQQASRGTRILTLDV